MKITCVACQSRFRLDRANIQVTGSLVKCSKCDFIFMTQLTDYDELVCQDTHIDQTILNELLEIESALSQNAVIEETRMISNTSQVNAIETIEDHEAKAFDPNASEVGPADLPDLSAFERMIDWDEVPETEEISDIETQTNCSPLEINGDV